MSDELSHFQRYRCCNICGIVKPPTLFVTDDEDGWQSLLCEVCLDRHHPDDCRLIKEQP